MELKYNMKNYINLLILYLINNLHITKNLRNNMILINIT